MSENLITIRIVAQKSIAFEQPFASRNLGRGKYFLHSRVMLMMHCPDNSQSLSIAGAERDPTYGDVVCE